MGTGTLFGILSCLAFTGAGAPQAPSVAPAGAATPTSSHPIALDDGSSVLYDTVAPFTGDLSAIWQRGELRVLVPYTHTEFFVSKGRPAGYVYEMVMHLQDWLNERRPKDTAKLAMVFVPSATDHLLPDLVAGKGDIAAGLITVTPAGRRLVAFSRPLVANVSEVVVRHKDAPALAAPEDLAGRTVHALVGSSGGAHIRELNERLSSLGRPPAQCIKLPASASREDLLEMVDGGMFPYAVTDSFVAELWGQVLSNLRVDEGAVVARGAEIAWAVRPSNPELLTALDQFISQRSKEARLTAAVIFQRYFMNVRTLRSAVGPSHAAKLLDFASFFQEAGEKYGFDWLLLGAQALQESQFDPQAKSRSGAVGLMQLLPKTAEEMGYPDTETPRSNVLAGAAYLHHLRSTYFSDTGPDQAEKIYFSLASYNAGPRLIGDMRHRAKQMGLDPGRWFGNVEVAVQHYIGDETVMYVANISRYYLAYRLSPQIPPPRNIPP